MSRTLTLGYSPCPNDTFIFYALAEGRIDPGPFRFDITLADVEALNRKTEVGELDVSKVSIHAILHILKDYRLLRAGGAIGRGCGPLVVARESVSMEQLRDATMAIPGELTTANLLLRLNGTHKGPRRVMPFETIMNAVAQGDVDAGVIIHESRFTYSSFGLKEVLDLGAWWEETTGLPLPLGGIVVKRDLGVETAKTVEEKIRESLLYSLRFPDEARPYIGAHAQEMEPEVIRRHIAMFVNDFSLDVGDEGEMAIRYLVDAASKLEGESFSHPRGIFWNDRL